MSFLTSFSQDTTLDTNNSYSSNLNAGVTYVGKATSTSGIAGIQVSIKTDQNATIYIEQSPGLGTGAGTVITNGTTSLSGAGTDFLNRSVGDEIYVSGETVRTIATIVSNTSLTVTQAFSTTASGLSYQYYNWDITDTYDYWAAINNFGVTVQAINSYLRVRVKNISTSNTTFFRLQTVLCPIVEAVPRTLDSAGNFKTAIKSMEDHYGFEIENTPMGEMRTISPVRLVGSSFEGTVLDTNFWSSTLANGGTVSITGNQVILATTTTASSSAILNSVRRARYVSGASLRFRANIRIDDAGGTTNNMRQWGVAYGTTMPTITDGAYFQLNENTLQLVLLKAGNATTISSGSFNGDIGSTYTIGNTIGTYEIYWTNTKVWFTVNDQLLHVYSASSTPWTETCALNIYMRNYTISGTGTAVNLRCRNAAIHRLGNLLTQPTSSHITTQAAQTILKYGPGNLHSIIVNNIANNSSINVYDNTVVGGIVLWSFTATAASSPPISLDFKGLPFFTGLTIGISGAASRVTTIYE